MLSRAAHSPHMQCIHRIILQLPELAGLGKLRQEAHVFGEINVAADAASRANSRLLKALGKQFGIEVARLQLPERTQQFLDRVRRAVHEVNVSEQATHPSDPTVQREAASVSAQHQCNTPTRLEKHDQRLN